MHVYANHTGTLKNHAKTRFGAPNAAKKVTPKRTARMRQLIALIALVTTLLTPETVPDGRKNNTFLKSKSDTKSQTEKQGRKYMQKIKEHMQTL